MQELLPAEVREYLDSWLLAEYETRNRLLIGQINQKKSELAAHGLLQSGRMIFVLVGLAVNEISPRSVMTFQRFLKAAEDAGIEVDENFRPYGRWDIHRRIQLIIAPELRNLVLGVLPNKVTNGAVGNALTEIDAAGDRLTRKCQAELDALVTRNKTRKQQRSSTTSGNVVNVSGAVGIIQIGSNNSATSIQHVDQSTRDGVDEVLEQLVPLVGALPDAALTTPKAELVEIIAESREELKKPQPNLTRLRSLLSAVAGTIQTVAALQPAYETLKGLLSLFGISS